MNEKMGGAASSSLAIIPPAWQAPPPRRLPSGTLAVLAGTLTPVPLILAFALGCFSLFYGVIFVALEAPTALLVAFGSPAIVALAATAGWVVMLLRRASLLRRGVCTVGRLESVEGAGAFLGSPRLSVRYRFQPGPDGAEMAGRTVTRDREELRGARPGTGIAVCFNPRSPQRSLALAAARSRSSA